MTHSCTQKSEDENPNFLTPSPVFFLISHNFPMCCWLKARFELFLTLLMEVFIHQKILFICCFIPPFVSLTFKKKQMESMLVSQCCCHKTKLLSFVVSNDADRFTYSTRGQKSKISLSTGLCSFWRFLWKVYLFAFSNFSRPPAFFGPWSHVTSYFPSSHLIILQATHRSPASLL